MKKLKNSSRSALTGFFFTLPSIIGMLVFFIIPFCITIRLSLTESMGNSKFVGLKNFSTVMKSEAFRLAAKNTFRFAIVAIPLVMITAFIIAVLLYKLLHGFDFFRTVFVFPLILPSISVVTVFRIVFENMGLSASPNGSFVMLLFLYVWKNVGYNIILFLSALNSVPKSTLEAAEIDGADQIIKIIRIMLPMIAPHTFSIFVISIVNLFKSFREAFILFGSHPDKSIYMIQHFMNNKNLA